ncbi:MAG: exodeoxyribonuclease small subunit [Clostridiales bacterium]|jgi:exodeoxyribonuclease VII small subunit|nr:exodeoxyribonuclease small subunit [Clostridiales bacterium]MDK2933379.1 exodeoxyribonuclease small subunit [Clostridiales bacterium]
MHYEELLKELEEIVRQLEEDELTLEQSLELFQKGVMLSKKCSKMLDDAEQKVSIILKGSDGKILEQPFHINQEETNNGV